MQKKLTVLFAFAIFVLVLGWAIKPVSAHTKFCPDPDHKHCNNDPVNESDEPIPVQVTFRDALADTIQSDCRNGTCPYIDGEEGGVGATMPVPRSSGGATEFANKFIMSTLTNPFLRRLFINFGNAVSDDGEAPPTSCPFGTLGCVIDAVGDMVECPFPDFVRPVAGDCAGPAPAVLTLRDVNDTADPMDMFGILITEMSTTTGGPFQVRSRHKEVQLSVPKKPGSRGSVIWNIEFEPLAEFCPAGVAEFLDVVATSDDDTNTVGDAERWDIGTDSGMKRACLIKGNRQKSVFVGVFDMAFEYEICILGSTTCP